MPFMRQVAWARYLVSLRLGSYLFKIKKADDVYLTISLGGLSVIL